MPTITLRPGSTLTNYYWTANPHLAIDEATANDSDYAYCAEAHQGAYLPMLLGLAGGTVSKNDITNITWRWRARVEDASGAGTSPNTGQLIYLFLANASGAFVAITSNAPTSAWTTYTFSKTGEQMRTDYAAYDWNPLTIAITSYNQTNATRSAVSWMECEIEYQLSSGIPMYHLLNIMQ